MNCKHLKNDSNLIQQQLFSIFRKQQNIYTFNILKKIIIFP